MKATNIYYTSILAKPGVTLEDGVVKSGQNIIDVISSCKDFLPIGFRSMDDLALMHGRMQSNMKNYAILHMSSLNMVQYIPEFQALNIPTIAFTRYGFRHSVAKKIDPNGSPVMPLFMNHNITDVGEKLVSALQKLRTADYQNMTGLVSYCRL